MKRFSIISIVTIIAFLSIATVFIFLNSSDTSLIDCHYSGGEFISSNTNIAVSNNAIISADISTNLKIKQIFSFQKNNVFKVVYICVCLAIIIVVVVILLIKIKNTEKKKRDKK